MSFRSLSTLSLFTLLLACGGGGGGSTTTPSAPAPQPVASPAMLPPGAGAGATSLSLQWLAPSGTIDGFELEARFGQGAYQKVHPGQLPAATLTYALPLPADLAETSDSTFRVRALRGSEVSPFSNEVTYHKPLATAGQPVGAYDWALGGTALAWASPSTVADGFVVKRAECANNGSPLGPWVTVQAVTSRTTTYLDTSAKAGTYYLYTITNTKGGETGAESPASAVVSTQVPSPTQLLAAFDAIQGGVALTWGSTFTQADGIRIERTESDATGLPLGTWVSLSGPLAASTTFLDTQVQEGTRYLYRISNLRGTAGSAPLVASTAVTVPPATPGALSAVMDLNLGAPLLTWTPTSTRATGVRIERAEADASGVPTKPWVSLDVPAGLLSTFTDRSAQEFARYVYRVANTLGATTGAPSALSSAVSTPLATPSKVVATYDTPNNRIQLTWQGNTTRATSVSVERAQVDASGLPSSTWTVLTTSGSTTGYTDAYLAEFTSYIYRVTNLANGAPSAASAPSAPVQTPLAPPSYVGAYTYSTASPQSIYVSWSTSYGTDRTYLLQRAEADGSGTPTSTWTTLSVPTGYQSGLTDSSIAEGKTYTYRLALTRDGYTTPFRQMSGGATVPLKAPTQLAATGKVRGIDLTWTPNSTAATSQVLRRTVGYESTDIATLAPGDTSYSDSNLPLGTYSYQVIAKAGSLQTVGGSVSGTTLNPADSLSLTSTTWIGPTNLLDAATTPTGGWAGLAQYPLAVPGFTGDSWSSYYLSGTVQTGANAIQVDSAGHPHTLYVAPSSSSATRSVVRHLWHDGTTWITEDLWEGAISNYSYYLPLLQFTLDSTGRPQALINTGTAYTAVVGSLSYLHHSAGTWLCEPLTNASNAGQPITHMNLSLDAADNPHILVQVGSDAVEILPDGTGGWTATTLSSEPLATSTTTAPLLAAWADAANGWLVYTTRSGSYPYTVTLKVAQKTAGVWQTPAALATISGTYGSGDGLGNLAVNASRSRIILGYATPLGLKLFHQASGTWHETLVGTSTNASTWFRMGMDSSNRLHTLVYTSGGTPYSDYHE